MVRIKQEDLIESVADALQYISYYHPVDYITNLARAYELEENPAAKDAMAQILINSRMCAEGHRPICQDTGIVTTFLKVGLEVQFSDAGGGPATMSLQEMVDEGVRGRGWIRTTSCADRSCAIRRSRARTRSTTRPAWWRSRW